MSDPAERAGEDVVLPEGTVILDLPPAETSVELALEVARLGVSDEAIEALGGEEALKIVKRQRAAASESAPDESTNGNPEATTEPDINGE